MTHTAFSKHKSFKWNLEKIDFDRLKNECLSFRITGFLKEGLKKFTSYIKAVENISWISKHRKVS